MDIMARVRGVCSVVKRGKRNVPRFKYLEKANSSIASLCDWRARLQPSIGARRPLEASTEARCSTRRFGFRCIASGVSRRGLSICFLCRLRVRKQRRHRRVRDSIFNRL